MRSVKSNLNLIAKALKPYLESFDDYDEKAVKKFLIGSEEVLNHVKDLLENCDDWNESEIDQGLSKIQENLELPTPKMNQPIRIALTGSTQSPSLGLTIKLMGQNKSIDLIQKAIRFLE
jgi:glutamyl-tRNA synthetase